LGKGPLLEHLLNLLLRSYDHNWQDDLLRQDLFKTATFHTQVVLISLLICLLDILNTGIIDKLKGFNELLQDTTVSTS
jgi:hypothetical protein